jgi:hypothetical protein
LDIWKGVTSLVNLESYLPLVENPEALGKREQELWNEIEPIILELLDELKANRKIETVFPNTKIEHMRNVMNNIYQLGINSNWLLHLTDSLENFKKFLNVASDFGFDESKYVSLYVQSCVLSVVLHTELFKVFLLFHLKDVNQRASAFNNTMENAARNAWAKLKPYVDSQFRNSLAHGAWAIENKQVILFEDADLVPFERLDLADFIIKAKKQNVLYACLVNVVVNKAKEGFFA